MNHDDGLMSDGDDKTTTDNNNTIDAVDARGQITTDSSKNNKTRSKPVSTKVSKSVAKKRQKKQVLVDDGNDSDEEHYIYIELKTVVIY